VETAVDSLAGPEYKSRGFGVGTRKRRKNDENAKNAVGATWRIKWKASGAT